MKHSLQSLGARAEIKKKYKEKVEVIEHIGPCEELQKYEPTVVPAVIPNEGKIKIIKESHCQPFRPEKNLDCSMVREKNCQRRKRRKAGRKDSERNR